MDLCVRSFFWKAKFAFSENFCLSVAIFEMFWIDSCELEKLFERAEMQMRNLNANRGRAGAKCGESTLTVRDKLVTF
jgi:hypothetical protein